MNLRAKKIFGLLSLCCSGTGIALMFTRDFRWGTGSVHTCIFGFLLAGLLLSLPSRPTRRAKVAFTLAVILIVSSPLWPVFG